MENKFDPWEELGKIQPLQENPFLYEKIQHRMQTRKETSYASSKLVYAFSALTLFLLLMGNVFVLTKVGGKGPEKQQVTSENAYALQSYYSYGDM